MNAAMIVPNNDVKVFINKRRAAEFASVHKRKITWSQAKDTASAEVLKSTPINTSTKMQWLNRHDRESGDLYGMLPLIQGMPVMLTDHVDRSKEKNLLRGSRGIIRGWELAQCETSAFQENDRILAQLPAVVYVKFDNATWTLPGMSEQGVYPVTKATGEWFLDKNRRFPVLKIKRRQIPLAPAFAVTAHAAQGTTKDAAAVDLHTPAGANPLTSYIALSRVRLRQDMLIFRPFPRSALQRRMHPGPQALLDKLQGKVVDWEALQRRLAPEAKLCSKCRVPYAVEGFTKTQWSQQAAKRVCRACQERFCKVCSDFYKVDTFTEQQWLAVAKDRVCIKCEQEGYPCGRCGVRYPAAEAWASKNT